MGSRLAGSHNTLVSNEIGMMEHVENVAGHRQLPRILLFPEEPKIMLEVYVQIAQNGAVHGVPGSQTVVGVVVEDSVAVRVRAGDDVNVAVCDYVKQKPRTPERRAGPL